jgi:Phosphotransferase enzyme family
MSELRNRLYVGDADGAEIELPAGDVTEGIVRVGDTVRRPHRPQSYAVAAYLDHLEHVGFEGSPRYLGRDNLGRDVLTFIEGDAAGAEIEERFLGEDLLASVARLVLKLHRASEGYEPTDEPFPARSGATEEPEIVSHLDITPQNLFVRDGQAFGIVDFDLAGPTTRFRDSYNAAMHWVPLLDPRDVRVGFDFNDQLRRLRVFADSYGWSAVERASLVTFGSGAAGRSWIRMKERAETEGGGWARMWSEGIGDLIQRRGRWLLDNEAAITAVLLAS